MGLSTNATTLLPNLAALRSITKGGLDTIILAGKMVPNDGWGGIFYLDETDTTSPDNGVNIIVTNAGQRWKTGTPTASIITLPKQIEFQVPAVTGNFSLSGVGFKPRGITINAIVNSTVVGYQSYGVYGMGVYSSYFTLTEGLGRVSGQQSNTVVYVKDIAAANICSGTWVSFDTDGATLNFSSVGLRPICLATMYA